MRVKWIISLVWLLQEEETNRVCMCLKMSFGHPQLCTSMGNFHFHNRGHQSFEGSGQIWNLRECWIKMAAIAMEYVEYHKIAATIKSGGWEEDNTAK